MGIVKPGILSTGDGGGIAWADVADKPTVFPSAWAEIADKPATFPADPPAWDDVTGKPATYPPDTSGLAAVSVSGSYNDLADQPTIPAESFRTETIQTTDATPTTVMSVLMNRPVKAFDVVVASHGSDAGFTAKLFAGFRNTTGVVTQLGNASKTTAYDSAASARDVTVVVNGTLVDVRVTGDAAAAVDWTVSLREV